MYVSAGSTALIDGGNETVVATCIAERARPPAEVSWESNLFGQSQVQLLNEVNGTTSTHVRYLWQPTRHTQGHALTCVVRHPALHGDFRVPYQLNVQCETFIHSPKNGPLASVTSGRCSRNKVKVEERRRIAAEVPNKQL